MTYLDGDYVPEKDADGTLKQVGNADLERVKVKPYAYEPEHTAIMRDYHTFKKTEPLGFGGTYTVRNGKTYFTVYQGLPDGDYAIIRRYPISEANLNGFENARVELEKGRGAILRTKDALAVVEKARKTGKSRSSVVP